MSSVLMILHTTVIKNSLFYLFRFIEKMKSVYPIVL